MTTPTFPTLMVAPAQVRRGAGVLATVGEVIARLGQRPLLVGGDRTLAIAAPFLKPALAGLTVSSASYGNDCSETALSQLQAAAQAHAADVVIGVGGGKALDAAKLIAHQRQLPVITVPTSAATCAAWTALSNVYSETGAFLYDVALDRCPDLLILDYDLIATAPPRTLIAGIGDALAKWYEGFVSSGASEHTLTIAAVQQARVLRDLLWQKTPGALAAPGGDDWREVVDACVLLAGVMGGLGGAQCRTVAAHAVHNGLTHLPASHPMLHGEKVAYGILVQLRLEEIAQQSALAATSRQQLIQFYDTIGLPKTLADMAMEDVRVSELQQAAAIACQPDSDIHHLPFAVTPEALMGALVTTTTPPMKATKSANASASASPSHEKSTPQR